MTQLRVELAFDKKAQHLLEKLITREYQLMSALDDLNQAIVDISVDIDNEIQALAQAQSSNNDAAIEQSVSKLQDLSSKLKTSIAPTQTVNPVQ